MPRPPFPAAALILALAACQPVPLAPGPPPGVVEAPPGAPPGTCWGKQVSPAVIETVTEQVQTAPAVTASDGRIVTPARYATETRQAIVEERRVRWIETPCPDVQTAPAVTASDGRIVTPARYATETRQAIVEERRVRWIETPCPDVQPPDFIASLQRALMARDLHAGPVTGRMDAPTREAVRRYQRPRGLDSDILSLESARTLGLVALPRPE